MRYNIKNVEVPRYPVLRITFDDGLSGEIDYTDLIGRGGVFAPLGDEDFFRRVEVDRYGHTFGWNLDQLGREIDFCPDATRIEIESWIVNKMADDFRAHRTAAQ